MWNQLRLDIVMVQKRAVTLPRGLFLDFSMVILEYNNWIVKLRKVKLLKCLEKTNAFQVFGKPHSRGQIASGKLIVKLLLNFLTKS